MAADSLDLELLEFGFLAMTASVMLLAAGGVADWLVFDWRCFDGAGGFFRFPLLWNLANSDG